MNAKSANVPEPFVCTRRRGSLASAGRMIEGNGFAGFVSMDGLRDRSKK
jgi:hypothetical protein